MDRVTSETNPLLDFSGLPRFREIRAEHVAPALDQLLVDNRAQRELLLRASNGHTWENFVQPLEDMNERLARMWSPVSHLNSVNNTPALRRAYNEGRARISEYHTELAQDERVYKVYREIAQQPAFAQLQPAQRKT